MNRFLIPLILAAGFFFLAECGIEEYYYLPQVPEGFVSTTLLTDAVINIPPISRYYAIGYTIFYRIYLSDVLAASSSDILRINSSLSGHYNALDMFTDPANSVVTTDTTFSSRGYYELELENGRKVSEILTTAGGTLRISFPNESWGRPVLNLNNGADVVLHRSRDLNSPQPSDNKSFQNTQELGDNANAVSSINADVSGNSSGTGFAYVSMYILAVGQNPDRFSRIYSKPTHINVFRLPDAH